MKASEIKRYFKNLGIPVRVRGGKHFVTIWIQRKDTGMHGPLVWEHEFPKDLRRKALVLIYGEEFVSGQKARGCSEFQAGNIEPHSMALRMREVEQLLTNNHK